ncbi:uncharacterized protein H6S33_010617 [Morchella sextelata]|uniref:uncharacterized protein n=1 Tax=Morchella sextelata TaxID=1174677 RepID=UPI001D04F47A|nr:uncharacterized protein H6S33_010617 [Morchella sextelata]KAH0611352.1 hypothetical protein H6S33_010617 [Morchella sextelata]
MWRGLKRRSEDIKSFYSSVHPELEPQVKSKIRVQKSSGPGTSAGNGTPTDDTLPAALHDPPNIRLARPVPNPSSSMAYVPAAEATESASALAAAAVPTRGPREDNRGAWLDEVRQMRLGRRENRCLNILSRGWSVNAIQLYKDIPTYTYLVHEISPLWLFQLRRKRKKPHCSPAPLLNACLFVTVQLVQRVNAPISSELSNTPVVSTFEPPLHAPSIMFYLVGAVLFPSRTTDNAITCQSVAKIDPT